MLTYDGCGTSPSCDGAIHSYFEPRSAIVRIGRAAGVALAKLPPLTPEQQEAAVDRMRVSTQHLQAIIDDVLATGGTVAATAQLIQACGGIVHGVAVLMELSFLPGRQTAGDLPVSSIRTV